MCNTWDWPEFWRHVHGWMRRQGYARSTALVYRQVLRNFARVAGVPPAGVTGAMVDTYLLRLRRGHCSAHWAALNLCTLRTVFDKLFGLGLLTGRPCPRRSDRLPEILSHDEALALMDACTTLRDRLLIGLLYGCGLTVSELRRLRWRDLDPVNQVVQASGNRRILPRIIALPAMLLPLAHAAHRMGLADVLVFTGYRADRSLSSRWIQCLVRDTAKRAGIMKPITPMSLRHTYAVHAVEAGTSIRELQAALGYRSVQTALRYCRCLLPGAVQSPLDGPAPSPCHARAETRTLFRSDAAWGLSLVRILESPAEFFGMMRCQVRARLFAARRETTGPP
jgi:site-specific recombinase XerD